MRSFSFFEQFLHENLLLRGRTEIAKAKTGKWK